MYLLSSNKLTIFIKEVIVEFFVKINKNKIIIEPSQQSYTIWSKNNFINKGLIVFL